jgi:DNA-binding CsgD family transcriptional regulator/tetratricopeptide (TPR) repeat protein
METVPRLLRQSSGFPFVGRASELETLRTLLPRAAGEGCRVVLVGGEPGSGKTRLMREFAREAASDGALVLYGSCDVVVRSPYGPFVEALDQLARATEPDALRAAMGAGAGELSRLLPDLSQRVGDLPPPVSADPDTERHRLHMAVAELLAGVTRDRPALLVVEDGHWADASSLLLLRHFARAPGSARVLLAATFRDTEPDVPEAFSAALAELRRSDDVIRLRIEGLSLEETAEFVRAAVGGGDVVGVAEVARAIHGLTGGNAFLVGELFRALMETGAVQIDTCGVATVTRPPAELASPESVREVVSQRLARLGPATTDLLEVAATAGAEFDLETVRRAAGLDEPQLLGALDEAVRSGMIEELPGRELPCRFTHELVRRALYDRLSRIRRAELHLRVAEALEDAAPRRGRGLADLAYHFAAAVPFGDRSRAVAYNLLAAQAASGALAFDEAAARLRTALDVGIESPEQRGDALLALGNASHRGGKALDALEAFAAAAQIAREVGDAELLARAAIGYEEACWRPGIVDEGAVELMVEAVATVSDEPSVLRVGLLGALGRALDRRGDHAGGAFWHTAAVAMARELDDRHGLATVLMHSYWSRGTSSLEEILAMLTEAKTLGRQLGDTEILAETMAWRVPTFVALGDLAAARREVADLRETAERTAQPFVLHVADHYGAALALCDGRLDEAERLAQRSNEWGRLLTGRDPSAVHGIQMFSIRREQGRLAEVAPIARILAGTDRTGPWRPGLAALLAELGMETEARHELRQLVAEGLEPLRQSLWLASLVFLTDASAAIGDKAVAALVYPELEPFAGSTVMIGHLVTCYGAADRYLGMLAATLGEADRAEKYFRRALDLNREMGAATWTAHTAYEYGRFLLARDRRPGQEAAVLLAEAATLSERIGMAALSARVRALGAAPAAPVLPDGLSPREVQILALVARGLSNREVGVSLSISEHTAANHVRSILRKTGCANRTEAASYAHRHRLV